MIFKETPIAGLLVLEPKVFGDERGFFLESFRQDLIEEQGLDLPFVQANTSRSSRGVLRGLHYQTRRPQGKLVRVSRGSVYDVAVDLREDSPTYGRHFGIILDDKDHRQLWVPPGFAHGFCVLSEIADFHYRCTDYYDPTGEGGIIWNDPRLGIEWPIAEPVVSGKDALLPPFGEHAPMLG
ncbi:MAG: dTDP-4-dehydrorhamnose 3,5-epimerase [Pseudodesulfovibrio sp.]|uniref:dTDP-4-dehydrorhamnose 3,5-epimerase n=1 Tax=Pseudodesulfovibrio indicus TaxID=1716143 RepID=A0A126QNP5_9BACT|nr:dTDP-4-dehydrorhamnose 3,5-epimerase [Pseudodesulfovibrio indicus]AMK11055.1 dTDP-4-dehydrorhamnose 3,5-epimerase [Pseudodesulfovibrio indicus]TDT92065.1 dTDP-4-dehydrorhamnose 3,5-epimerase [Pseudodesulfovibrio indicus]